MMKTNSLLAVSLFFLSSAHAAALTSEVYATETGEKIGEVVFEDSEYGLLIKPALHALPAGKMHGFHLHQQADCGDKGMKAGGHYDPANTNAHAGPYGNGHLGDLPVLAVDSEGQANTPLLAPRLKTSDLKGLAVMIHAGGDNYSDNPPLGGGGARIACGTLN
ncbi:superoxide dismutase [Legionella taurinensis]|uniref:Superoxide dismutase n=1 Tax=Legionella taurinensis TaxID=70611 RepID=A0AB38N658_9GAMM|nr:superoxide dismutase family protein [Legionella taurinensis]MDX1837479.1 superoxide dismutase family protein [Legionella taurinensis]PUT40917.1 superoxide dismutase [Legionella taurinensis]PUT44340.1 superoxide dismutase [Legionella taurinensis]PUT47619.1 superoxide dismutase [Legionella taurinensis]PUT48780.1 superoxide dismutase [Legionella taurinensis]